MQINNKLLFSISNMMRTIEVLLISVVLSRFLLDKNVLGELLQVIFVSSILVTLISGLPLSLNFFYGKYDNLKSKQALFGKFSLITLGVSTFFCVVIFSFKSTLSSCFQNTMFTSYIYIILLFYWVKQINTIFPNYHYLKNHLKKYLSLYFLTFIILFGCFIYNYVFDTFKAEIIILQLFCVELLRLVINTLIIKRKELIFDVGSYRREEFTYIFNISVGVTLGAFNLYMDKYLIAILLSPTDFVFYQNGAINLPFVNIITSSLFIALIPVFAELQAKNKIKELTLEIKKAIFKCSFFLIPILVYCFFEAIPLIKFLYGDDFEMSGKVFKIYVLRYSLSVMAFSIFMGSIGLEKKANAIIALSALIGLALNVILIPKFHTMGAAWATVVASLSTIGISFYFIKKKLNIPIIDFFPIKNYFSIILLSVVVYIPFYILNKYFDLKWFVVLASVIYYFIILVILNNKFKAFDLKKFFIKV
ncbi:MAG: polysaccharide biosynthesis C-terminal domain-containing protein [Flavobacteriaceae bacterium]